MGVSPVAPIPVWHYRRMGQGREGCSGISPFSILPGFCFDEAARSFSVAPEARIRFSGAHET